MNNKNLLPKVSVVVPCYNMKNYLHNCFNSLQNQTYNNLEIIFVNDGSKDETATIIKNFIDKKPALLAQMLN